jgi:GrpB-like predicted nucleotidyltransferase (UPF0157 family)
LGGILKEAGDGERPLGDSQQSRPPQLKFFGINLLALILSSRAKETLIKCIGRPGDGERRQTRFTGEAFQERKMVLGLQSGVVEIVAYQKDWAHLYEEEKQRITAAIGEHVLEVQHVGSTSIPGMPSKPIVDIGIAVHNFEEAQVCILPMQAIGHEYKGEFGIPRRHYFIKGEPRTHHVHMVEEDSRDWQGMLLFRDFLRAHPDAARDYADLKRRLASQHRTDAETYTNEKGPVIQKVLKQAK